MTDTLSRRQWLAAGAAASLAPAVAHAGTKKDKPFGYMFNTATIMGQNLSLVEQIDITAKAGYDAFEPWIRDMEKHVSSGKTIKDAAKRIKDHGLKVESAIGFAAWVVDNDAQRKKGLEQAKRDMDLVQQLGGDRLAAPPVGATEQANLSLMKAADRYRELCEVGAKLGVVPQVELWGHSKALSRLGETALVALESAHPNACILADVFHLHKGGSGFAGLKLLSGASLQVFHMNDYPADPPRARIKDEHRVFPGDGVAPLGEILRDLHKVGFRGLLSLELFNREYWKQDPLQVARTGLAKMKAVVDKAMAS